MLKTLDALGAIILLSNASSAYGGGHCEAGGPGQCPSDERIAAHSQELREHHIFFPRGGANLDEDARGQIALLSRVLGTQAMMGTCLKLADHSDSSGSATANLRLSERRAEAVRAELSSLMGSSAPKIEVTAMGEDELLASMPSTHVAQRRVTIWARACQKG